MSWSVTSQKTSKAIDRAVDYTTSSGARVTLAEARKIWKASKEEGFSTPEDAEKLLKHLYDRIGSNIAHPDLPLGYYTDGAAKFLQEKLSATGFSNPDEFLVTRHSRPSVD